MTGGCESCGDKEKDQLMEKLREDAKKKAQQEGKAIAICKGQPEGYFLQDAFEAVGKQQVVDIIHFVQ